MMKALLLYVVAITTLVSAAPSQHEDDRLSPRAVNDQCKAPEGTGSCQNTSNCPGISYPTGLCPNDPVGVQCCVNIGCNVPNQGSGYCRSVTNNGCSGGTFHTGFCPGSTDIRCCVKSAPSSTPLAAAPNLCTAAAFDKLVFQDSISTFIAAKNAKSPACFDWSDDGCSCSPDELGEFDFRPPCWRHDFGYRNAKKQGLFNAAMKERIDNNFKNDLYNVCSKFSGWESFKGVQCRRIADIYVAFVRRFGKKKRDIAGARLEKRDCDLVEAIFG